MKMEYLIGLKLMLVIIVVVLLTGCKINGDRLSRDFNSAIDAINETATKLQTESNDWQTIMDSLLMQLETESDDWQQLLGFDLPNRIEQIIEEGLAMATGPIFCITDKTVDRVTKQLLKTVQEMKQGIIIPFEDCPIVCGGELTPIYLNNPNDAQIIISGYDFKATPYGLYVLVSNDEEIFALDPDVISTQTNYQITINLNNMEAMLRNYSRLTLKCEYSDSTLTELDLIK